MDERFILHRYYSTRFSAIVTAVAMAGWINYEYFANQVLRWDILAFLVIMALTKAGAMVYYRITH